MKLQAAILVAVLLRLPSFAQQQDVIRTSTNEVVVDVVVRDKKGKLVRGLAARDFTVLEDGLPQQVTSVRELSGSLTSDASTGAEGSASGSLPDATKTIRLITLVFDRLGIDSRRLARQAANDLIKEQLASNVYIAVFTSDLHLRAVQPFTNDREKIRLAIEKAAGGSAMTNYADVTTALKQALDSSAGGEGASASAAAGSRGGGVDGAAMAQESMNRMVADMLEFAETSSQEQQGRSSIFGLWGVVKEQTRLPGRKTVLYFSEGLQLPNGLLGQFRGMIASANRANVSVYAIDARGLSVDGDSGAARDMLATSARVSQGTYKTETTAVTRVEANQFDRAMDSIRANPQVNLAELAESTGGFLIANMNDFRQPLRRLLEEAGSYYEVLYRSSNSNLDGSFRAIETKLSRTDVKVQSRSGYYALPGSAGANVLPHEVPLLNALSANPQPRGVDYRAGVVRGKPTADGYRVSIVFEMPMKDITFRSLKPDPLYRDDSSFLTIMKDTTLRSMEVAQLYRIHSSFLAIMKDSQGHVAGKLSRDLPVNLPKDKLPGFQSGRVIFTRNLVLPTGRYTLESAAADVEGKRVAARRSVVIIPKPDPAQVALSGPVLVRRLDDATAANSEQDDPFVVGGKRVIPTLQDRVTIGEKNALSFFFTIYPGSGLTVQPTAEIEFLFDDKSLGAVPVVLPAAQPDGSIPYIATIPLGRFQPGLYEVRVRARQGKQTAMQTFFVTMEP